MTQDMLLYPVNLVAEKSMSISKYNTPYQSTNHPLKNT